MTRIIAHLDMDAFFAAIEERDRPKFKGLPIVIGADPMEGKGRGVVSTANYKAREYGIRSATPISFAWQMSEEARKKGLPPVVFLFPNFSKYEKSSLKIVEIVRKFSLVVEPASIDEMYFDLSRFGSFKKAEEICEEIKREIKKEEKLTCSIGVGSNKLIAKIASDVKKPDGLTIVEKGKEETFLENFPIRKIPGIGPKTEEVFLRRQGIGPTTPTSVGLRRRAPKPTFQSASRQNFVGAETSRKNKNILLVKDLKKISKDELKKMLGKWGEDLYFKIRGVDDSPIVEKYEIKSIGEQETFLKDMLESKFMINRLSHISESVFERFKKSEFKNFKTITITVRFAGFETKTRSRTLAKPSSDLKALQFEALKLLTPFLDKRENPKRKFVRLIGVRVEKLT